MRGETRLVACLWVIFVIRGLFYAAFIPLWEGFDEWAHYAVIQRLALGKQLLVARGERVSREVDASLQMAPSLYGSLSRNTYWQLRICDRYRLRGRASPRSAAILLMKVNRRRFIIGSSPALTG